MIDKETAIEVRGVSKRFIIQKREDKLKNLLIDLVHGRQQRVKAVQALKDVSFSVKKGEFFGVIGRNGSGKSTLLKILAGVYSPDVGEVQVDGRLTPFIELGVGFNPELSGRDNIFLNGALLGFSHKEMEAMYDDIVSFAELEYFMDQRLKNYSSGMQVRLAFSIAVQAQADILLIDEVLAVGDEAFQQKCWDIFEQHKAAKKTVVFVTHDMHSIKKFCDRAVLIDNGKIVKIGDPNETIDEYRRLNQQTIDDRNAQKNARLASNLSADKRIEVQIRRPGEKHAATSFTINEDVRVSISWREKLPSGKMMLDLYRNSGEHITSYTCSQENSTVYKNKRQALLSTRLNLSPGTYYFVATLVDRDFTQRLLVMNPAYEFSIRDDWSEADYVFNGITGFGHKWINN